MPSQFRETYLYYAGNKEVKSIRISGINKKDTDEKFTAFLIDFNTNRHDTMLLRDFIEQKYKPTFLPKLSPTTQATYNLYLTSTSCLIWEIKSLEISRWKTSSACLIH